MKTDIEQERKWNYDKSVCLIMHKMNLTPRHLWPDTFEILAAGHKDKKQLKRDVWKRMQH